MEDHGHDHGHEEAVTTEVELTPEPAVLETVGHEGHDHSGLNGLFEVMFGLEHVIAEIFWNTVWLGAAFAIGRIIAFRKVHKYIDDKHGVTHNKSDY